MSSGAEVVPDRVVLDTSAYSQFRGGETRVMDMIAAAVVVHLPAIVLGELQAGFQLGERYQENARSLAEFQAEPFVMPLPVTPEVARRYGRVFASLRRKGTPIPINDVWIAAVTITAGAHLVTFDSDFRHVEGLDHTLL